MSLETNELINILTRIPPGQRPMRCGLLALLILGTFVLMTLMILGLRPEFVTLQLPASFWMKSALLAAVMIVSVRELKEASQPVLFHSKPYLALGVAIVALLLVGSEWMVKGSAVVLASFYEINFPSCLFFVSVYGSMGMIAFTLLMRQYAPAHSGRCGGLIGLASAATAALGYSIHCPFDSPTFIVVSYGLPMIVLWILGRVVLPRWLNW